MEIILNDNNTALIDQEDYEYIKAHSNIWRVRDNYVVNATLEKLHNIIMEKFLNRKLTSKEFIDHIDHNGLNNQQSNLRIATKQQNQFNRRKCMTKQCSSQYKGVTKIISAGKTYWTAAIHYNKKQIYLGHYKDELLAAQAYNDKAIEIFGEYAYLNDISRGYTNNNSINDNQIDKNNKSVLTTLSGELIFIDEEYYDLLNLYTWQLMSGNYACTYINSKRILMHRFIMEHVLQHKLKSTEFIDHIDRNKLNNRKENLRIVTNQQNQLNVPKINRSCTSQYKGVFAYKLKTGKTKYVVYISIDNKQYNMGSYNDEQYAAEIYDIYAYKYYGEYAYLNILTKDQITEDLLNTKFYTLNYKYNYRINYEDEYLLQKYYWFISCNYIKALPDKNQPVWLHRLIMENILQRPLYNNELVYHIDGNTHNNIRKNLAIKINNIIEVQHYISSPYTGICKYLSKGKLGYTEAWMTRINQKPIYTFTSPHDAYQAYITNKKDN